ncbi:hypothetical protein D3C73_1609730 [compost metagenome]
MARLDQALQSGRAVSLLACSQALLGSEIAEVRQPLLTHLRQVIRELGKLLF